MSKSTLSIQQHQPLNSLNTNTISQSQQRAKRRRHSRNASSSSSSTTTSMIDAHIGHLRNQWAQLEKQSSNPSLMDPNCLKPLLDKYHYHRLQLEARYRIEQERITRRYDAETRSTRAQFAAKKGELKEILLDRLRRKRKLVVEEMRSAIDIHSRSFDADPLLVTMQPPHPLQAKAYNFRQRPDMGQQTSSSSTGSYNNDDEFSTLLAMNNIGSNGILSPIPQQAARKRLLGAFSVFQLPKWTVRDEECEEDLKSIATHHRK